MARSAIHPGEHLVEELEALDMSAAELARRLKVPTNRVTEILNGQRAITGDTARASPISSEPAPSFGSICRASTNCASPGRRLANQSGRFPP